MDVLIPWNSRALSGEKKRYNQAMDGNPRPDLSQLVKIQAKQLGK